jgi:hypothetical protein
MTGVHVVTLAEVLAMLAKARMMRLLAIIFLQFFRVALSHIGMFVDMALQQGVMLKGVLLANGLARLRRLPLPSGLYPSVRFRLLPSPLSLYQFRLRSSAIALVLLSIPTLSA